MAPRIEIAAAVLLVAAGPGTTFDFDCFDTFMATRDVIMAVEVENENCTKVGGYDVAFSLNLEEYAERAVRAVPERARDIVRAVGAYAPEVRMGLAVGLCLCLPRACDSRSDALPRIVLWRIFMSLPHEVLWDIPLPNDDEFRIIDPTVDNVPGCSTKEPPTPMPTPTLRRVYHRSSEPHREMVFKEPCWINCRCMPTWRRWLRMALHGRLLRGRTKRPLPAALRLSSALLTRYMGHQIDMVNCLERVSNYGCGTPLHSEKDFGSKLPLTLRTCPPLAFPFMPRSSPNWGGEFVNWVDFCPMGYVAALFVQARGALALRRRFAAWRLLATAQKMLGRCGAFDLLDPTHWGFGSEDIEAELIAIEEHSDSGMGNAPPSPSSRSLDIVWHALQLNTLVRLRLRDLAPAGAGKAPQLALITAPRYLSLFLVPVLEHIFGEDLCLKMFYIAGWTGEGSLHEKCPECMDRYWRRYVVHDSALQSIPYNHSHLFRTGSGGILWGPDFTLNHFIKSLNMALEHNPFASKADVLLCTAPLWLCTAAMFGSPRPVLVLDIMVPTNGAPDAGVELEADPYLDVLMSWQENLVVNGLSDWLSMPSADDPVRMPTPKLLHTLWVRTDPLWAYGRGLEEPYARITSESRGFFYPFVFSPSMYVKARYECVDNADLLVMREGSWPGKFALILRGFIFFHVLSDFLTRTSPWHFNLLPFNPESRPSYKELARHRLAIWAPLAPCCKATFADLIAMEIPLFMPAPDLQAAISALWYCGAVSLNSTLRGTEVSCRREEVQRWLPLSRFQRYPHIQPFASLANLITRLREITRLGCSGLSALSASMADWNRALVADDAEFWKLAIGVLQKSGTVVGGPMGGKEEERRTLPRDRPPARLPRAPGLPRFELPQVRHCSAMYGNSKGRDRCAESAQQLLEWSPASEAIPPPHGVALDHRERCLWGPAEACDEGVLRYSTHLLQELPVLPSESARTAT